jgi:hypothetical protein
MLFLRLLLSCWTIRSFIRCLRDARAANRKIFGRGNNSSAAANKVVGKVVAGVAKRMMLLAAIVKRMFFWFLVCKNDASFVEGNVEDR